MLVVLPLMTAVMYQLLLAMGFVAILAVVGHAPLLALAVAAACLMAARTRLRRDYPFLAAAFGLLPICVYLYFAHMATDVDMLLPMQTWLLAVPLIGAVVLMLLAEFATVLMARLTRFQPGVLWPVSVVLLPTAVALLVFQVGLAELHYALLIETVRPGDALLTPRPQADILGPDARGLNRTTRQVRIDDDLQQRRDTFIEECDRFLNRYGESAWAPSVAWIRAEAASLQVDRSSSIAPIPDYIVYVSNWPRTGSRTRLQQLLEDYPASNQAAIARLKLALLDIRNIDASTDADTVASMVRDAYQRLVEAENKLLSVIDEQRDQDTSRILVPLPHLPTTSYYASALDQASYLRWIIENNQILPPRHSGQPYDPKPARALAKLLSLNPYRPAYVERLQALADDESFLNSPMSDNLAIIIARLEPNLRRRAEALLDIAADQRTDAAIEAHFELGRIAMQTDNDVVEPFVDLQPPQFYFQQVLAAPTSPFQAKAARDLRWLKETAPPAGEATDQGDRE
jgi:hypothetical protein